MHWTDTRVDAHLPHCSWGDGKEFREEERENLSVAEGKYTCDFPLPPAVRSNMLGLP